MESDIIIGCETRMPGAHPRHSLHSQSSESSRAPKTRVELPERLLGTCGRKNCCCSYCAATSFIEVEQHQRVVPCFCTTPISSAANSSPKDFKKKEIHYALGCVDGRTSSKQSWCVRNQVRVLVQLANI